MYGTSDGNGNIILTDAYNDERQEVEECPKPHIPTPDSMIVYEMGLGVDNDYLLLDLSSEYMGVFDYQGRLIHYFSKDRDSDGPILSSEVRDISDIEDLIGTYEKEVGQKKAVIEAYVLASELPLRRFIENDLGLDLAGLSLQEQIWLTKYLTTANVEDINRVKEYIATFGMDGICAFLSMEYDSDMGDKIIKLAEDNPEKLKGVLSAYNQLIKTTQDFENQISANKIK
jgi:hypothetical protein